MRAQHELFTKYFSVSVSSITMVFGCELKTRKNMWIPEISLPQVPNERSAASVSIFF